MWPGRRSDRSVFFAYILDQSSMKDAMELSTEKAIIIMEETSALPQLRTQASGVWSLECLNVSPITSPRPVHTPTRKPGDSRPGITASHGDNSGETGLNDVLWMLPRRQIANLKGHLSVTTSEGGLCVEKWSYRGIFPLPLTGIENSPDPGSMST
jgi:hypothetical protein